MIRVVEPTLTPLNEPILAESIRYEVAKAQLDLNVNHTHLCKLLPQLLQRLEDIAP